MISVIVPVYNVEPYLCRCVDSILNQTFRDIEVLLIDDGSTDRCGKICDEYAKKDKRIRVFHTENRGLSAARNIGLREAKGEYFGFVDSDDWIEPDMYEELLTRLKETAASISVCGLWYEYKTFAEKAKNMTNSVFIGDDALNALIFSQLKNYSWNKLYCRNLWEGISFPEGHVFEDVATIYKVVIKSRCVVSNTKCLYHYTQRVGSIGSTQSMNNLIDYYGAYYSRYLSLVNIPKYKENQVLRNKLMEQVANGATRTWRWIYKIPRDKRNVRFLKKVSLFVKNNYPLFGKTDWKLYLRVSVFLTRFVNEIAFATGYYMNYIYRGLKNVRRI